MPAVAAFVLAPAPGTAARISRRSGGYVLAVDPMAVDLHLFRHLAGLARFHRRRPCRHTGTHPAFRPAELAQELSEAGSGLDALAAGDQHSDVRAALSWSYRRLDPDSAQLLRLVSLHPGSTWRCRPSQA